MRTLRSHIESRFLLNFHADPEAVQRVLPPGLTPHRVNGRAVVGVCFLTQTGVRPDGIPRCFGIRVRAAAHRFAVVREDGTRAARMADSTPSASRCHPRGRWSPCIA